MTRTYTLILAMLCAASISLTAQVRYLDEIFTDVTVTEDVQYGVNGTVLTLPQFGEAVPEDLLMDIYQPEGDTHEARPLALVFHSGNFLPIVTNGQITGYKKDNSVIDLCNALARRGYVAAAVDYRLGWNPFAETQPLRALGIIQAAYRGVQDGRTAVRYFRKSVAEGNPYNINGDQIMAFGLGTGGYITLAMATLDDYNEILSTTNGPAKFVLDNDGDGTPETPMIVEAFHGDLNGEIETVVPADGFGLPAGDTTNYANNVGYASDIQLCVNVGGALGDLSWIDENSAPIITVHSVNDLFAPYDDAVLSVPGQNLAVVQVQGGGSIHTRVNELGLNSIYEGYDFTKGGAADVTNEAIANSATAGHDYYPGLYPWVNEPNSSGLDEAVVLNWWDPNAPAPGAGMGIPWNMLPHPSGGTFHDQELVLNENMSAEKARANLAKVMSFVTPRAAVALGLEEAANVFSENPPTSGERYLEEIFEDVTVTNDVVYGVNGTVLTLPQFGEAVPEELKMDIYEPTGDTSPERPLMLVFHNGNFLPIITNGQISGYKKDNDVIDMCTSLAKRGFVAVAVEYRLGWNPFAETQPLRALGIIQAAYRGLQDGRNAIRYMRKTIAEDSNPYRIDESRITAFGIGTGGYLTLAMATLNDYNEIITTTNGPAKFVLDNDGDGTPETPMIVEAFHGDINGVNETITPAEGFGFPAGDTTNYSNYPTYSSDFNLAVNVGGALGDLSWIDENSVPIITVQSANDMFAPYGDAVLSVPGQDLAVAQVQGGSAIHPRMEELGLNSIYDGYSFNQGLFSEVTATAEANSEIAGHPYYTGLFPWIREPNSLGLSEGVVLNWWDPNAPAPGAGMGIPFNMLPHPSGGTFHDQGLVLNENMSAEKSRANRDEVLGFVLPRAAVVLQLPGATQFLIDNVDETYLSDETLKLFPNPATSFITIEALNDLNIQSVQVYDANAQLQREYSNLNVASYNLSVEDLNAGLHIVKAYFEEGVVTKKVMIQK